MYLGRLTALKILHHELCDHDPVAEEQFRRGALLAARISHPGVAQIYDFERTPDGTCLLAMEFVDGETLGQRLQRAGPIAVPEAARLLTALADGLDHAHGLGVLHRDLKPENVMLAPSSGVKILDFGIALEARSPVASDGFAWGTPAYMSPEQLLGEPVGPTSDVYALGVLLYETLTGRLPHTGETVLGLLADKLTRKPRLLHPLRVRREGDSGGEAGLADAIAGALAPDPVVRWASAGAFARAVAAALEGAPTPALPAAWSQYCQTA